MQKFKSTRALFLAFVLVAFIAGIVFGRYERTVKAAPDVTPQQLINALQDEDVRAELKSIIQSYETLHLKDTAIDHLEVVDANKAGTEIDGHNYFQQYTPQGIENPQGELEEWQQDELIRDMRQALLGVGIMVAE